MIKFNNLGIQRGTKVLLDRADLAVFPGQKIGVIGANGSGKSTVFKMLSGELSPDSGECTVPAGWEVAIMAQEIAREDADACDFVLAGDRELGVLNDQIASQQYEGEALANLFARLEAIDGYTALARAEKLLYGLGFNAEDSRRPVNAFSGGWRIRLNLARALMCRSDLLLLDEPTNHLDLDACLWLERWLQEYQGTLIVISHDRDFLDNLVDGIVSFENQRLVQYSGNYSAFEKQKAARLAEQEAAYERQQVRIAEIESFVRRFKAKASKAKQAQSRLKELERMESIAPAHIDSPFSFRFAPPDKLPQQLLALKDVSFAYAQKPVLNHANLNIHADTRIALLGANGAGKTTVIKMLADMVRPTGGERVEGAHVRIGYFAQHQLEALDPQASCFLHIQRLDPGATEQAVRNFLGGFDFHGERVFEPIEHFSGGEKARLALAMVTWQKPNLLLLDEPTNHLDIEMRHALTVALQGFEGALVMISHDRHLIRNTAEEFYLVHSGSVEAFAGDLDDYYRFLATPNKSTTNKSTPNKVTATHEVQAVETSKRNDRKQAANSRERQQPLRKRLKQLEAEMEKLNAKLKEAEAKLADSSLYQQAGDELSQWLKLQGQARDELALREEEWLTISEELESD